MDEFVAKENIRRFEAQLADCADDVQRRTLLRLLKAERKRLNDAQSGAGLSMRNDGGNNPMPHYGAPHSAKEDGSRTQ